MANPISDLQALARAPLEAARDLAVIAQALEALPELSAAVEPLPDAIVRVPAIEDLLLSLVAMLKPALADVTRLRKIVDAQQEQVTHIETLVGRIDRRTQVIERSIVDLQTKADTAMSVLPDPDDEERGPLAKARDAITGG